MSEILTDEQILEKAAHGDPRELAGVCDSHLAANAEIARLRERLTAEKTRHEQRANQHDADRAALHGLRERLAQAEATNELTGTIVYDALHYLTSGDYGEDEGQELAVKKLRECPPGYDRYTVEVLRADDAEKHRDALLQAFWQIVGSSESDTPRILEWMVLDRIEQAEARAERAERERGEEARLHAYWEEESRRNAQNAEFHREKREAAERREARLMERIQAVVPYVIATLPKPHDGHPPGAPEGWGTAHMGRSMSSVRQLEDLLALSDAPDEDTQEGEEDAERAERSAVPNLPANDVRGVGGTSGEAETDHAAGRIGQRFHFCPMCGGELDTGWECNICDYDCKPLVESAQRRAVKPDEDAGSEAQDEDAIRTSEPCKHGRKRKHCALCAHHEDNPASTGASEPSEDEPSGNPGELPEIGTGWRWFTPEQLATHDAQVAARARREFAEKIRYAVSMGRFASDEAARRTFDDIDALAAQEDTDGD